MTGKIKLQEKDILNELIEKIGKDFRNAEISVVEDDEIEMLREKIHKGKAEKKQLSFF